MPVASAFRGSIVCLPRETHCADVPAAQRETPVCLASASQAGLASARATARKHRCQQSSRHRNRHSQANAKADIETLCTKPGGRNTNRLLPLVPAAVVHRARRVSGARRAVRLDRKSRAECPTLAPTSEPKEGEHRLIDRRSRWRFVTEFDRDGRAEASEPQHRLCVTRL